MIDPNIKYFQSCWPPTGLLGEIPFFVSTCHQFSLQAQQNKSTNPRDTGSASPSCLFSYCLEAMQLNPEANTLRWSPRQTEPPHTDVHAAATGGRKHTWPAVALPGRRFTTSWNDDLSPSETFVVVTEKGNAAARLRSTTIFASLCNSEYKYKTPGGGTGKENGLKNVQVRKVLLLCWCV